MKKLIILILQIVVVSIHSFAQEVSQKEKFEKQKQDSLTLKLFPEGIQKPDSIAIKSNPARKPHRDSMPIEIIPNRQIRDTSKKPKPKGDFY